MLLGHRVDEQVPAILQVGDHHHADDADDELAISGRCARRPCWMFIAIMPSAAYCHAGSPLPPPLYFCLSGSTITRLGDDPMSSIYRASTIGALIGRGRDGRAGHRRAGARRR